MSEYFSASIYNAPLLKNVDKKDAGFSIKCRMLRQIIYIINAIFVKKQYK